MTKGIATSWTERCEPARVAAVRASVDEALEMHAALSPPLELAVPTQLVAFLVATDGPSACRSWLEQGHHAYEQVLARLGHAPSPVHALLAAHTLQWELLCMTCGVDATPIAARAKLLAMLHKERGQVEPELPSLAFLAIAESHVSGVAAWLDGATTARFEAGQTFGFNTQGFAHYLAKAFSEGAGLVAVEPAWDEFVAGFPRKAAAGTLEDVDLLAAARVVYECIGGEPTRAVGQRLHEKVRKLVEAGS